ncbi:MAG: hypothetical protein ABIC82_02470 [bacterium]
MTLKEIIKSITRQEWKKIFWFNVAVIFITAMPFVYGYYNAPNGKILSGIHSLTPVDLNVYYSYLEQAKQGRIIFVDLFTSETQTPLIFNIFWLGAGLAGKILKLNNIITFQLARILLIPVFAITVYLFISYFFTDKRKRQTALIFILFSSGIGGILAPILEKFAYESYGYYHWPLDMWIPESTTFLTLFHMPHFIASLTLIILIFLFTLLAWENNKLKYEIYAGLCALVLFQFHPFHISTIFGVLGGYFLFLCFLNKKILFPKLRSLIILLLFTLPNLIYHLCILQNSIIKQRAMQNVCLTPAWWLSLIGFGFLVPLATMGVYYIFTKMKDGDLPANKYYFLVVWLVVQSALIYTPTALQRRMSEGLHIVLCILAVIAVFALIENAQQKINPNKLDKIIIYIYSNKILLIVIFVIFFSFSNMLNIARDVVYYENENILFYLPVEKKESFDWIKNNTDSNAVFLSHTTTCNFIAGNTGRFIYAGHGTETLFFEKKQEKIKWFFSENGGDQNKIEFLKSNNINFIYYSDWEKIYSKDGLGFAEKDYLDIVYKNNLVEIYRVN